MTRDEMKDRISLALKDPILQQGFEVICKENTELEARVKWYSEQVCNKECAEVWGSLDKAKDIVKNLLDDLTVVDGEQARELTSVKEAERFLEE